MRRRWPVVIGLLAAAALAACTAQRPLHVVQTSGDWHYDRGEYEAAAEQYQEIVERSPGDWPAHYRLGLCRLETGDHTEARRSLEIAYAQQPDRTEIVDALAEAMFRQGDETRLFAFLRERAQSTQSTGAYVRLAEYSLELNDYDSANLAIETAIELDDGRSARPYLLGADLAQRVGDREMELRRLRQAYGIDPRHETVNARLRAMGQIPGPTLALPPGR